MNQLTASKNCKKQSAFQKLWKQAERHKQQNARFEQELEALVDRIQTSIQPAERQAAQARKPLLFSLIKLAQRKSLAQWQRLELDEWIIELMQEMHGFSLIDQELMDDLARYDAFRLGVTLDDGDCAPPSEQLADIINREQQLQEDAEREAREESQDSHGEEDEYDDLFNFDFDFDDDNFEAEPADLPGTPKITNQVFQRLFRTTATKLHPDREPDPVIREKKQGLMGDLLQARKSGDVMAILALHEEYVDDQEGLSKADEKQLIQVLENQINELKSKKEYIALKSPMHWMAYQHFYFPSKNKVDSAIAAHLHRISQDKIQTEKMVTEIRTLKALKPWLEQRYDSHDPMAELEELMNPGSGL